MLRNRFSAKLIGLLLTTLFFSGLQSVSAVEIKETDISTADTCSVSLKSVWSPYGGSYLLHPNKWWDSVHSFHRVCFDFNIQVWLK